MPLEKIWWFSKEQGKEAQKEASKLASYIDIIHTMITEIQEQAEVVASLAVVKAAYDVRSLHKVPYNFSISQTGGG